ncbi:catechol 2,3-dioxygenase-like lactoylglutathione lyase family enzyme [Arthrobacter sp. CAN_A6]|uniref:VOC family protein n=1 Tax=Arthrobacter sp. CAN_A6 TaxID=2787721 RepID=UPI0018CB9EA0
MIGKFHALVIDCEDIEPVARFYEELLGMQRVEGDADWITIGDAADRPALAFQRVDKLTPPDWPSAVHPQQMHLDVRVDDLDEGEKNVLALGAKKQGYEQEKFRVYLDPAGHPFCLVSW